MKRKLLLLIAALAGMAQVSFAQAVSPCRGSVNMQLLGTYGLGGISIYNRIGAKKMSIENNNVEIVMGSVPRYASYTYNNCKGYNNYYGELNVPYQNEADKKVFPTGINILVKTPTSEFVQKVGYVLYYLFVPTDKEYIKNRLPAFPPRYRFGKYF